MFLLIKNVSLYTPLPSRARQVLVAGDRFAWVGDDFPAEKTLPDLEVWDGAGKILVPGFVDNHVHILGGGGEGGFATRTPEIALSSLIRGGITSVVGVLGTDGVTRSTAALVAKARALEEEGISAWALLGSYEVPIRSLTGDVTQDLMLVDKLLGVGEIALSDHRSSQPSPEELAHLAAWARLGGMLSGKAGVINVHLGDGPQMFSPLRAIAASGEIPLAQFVPTHVNRNETLFAEGIRYALDGGRIDLTTASGLHPSGREEVPAAQGLRRLLDAAVPLERITFSSDGQGSLPNFDASGRLRGLAVGSVGSLWQAVRDAVQHHRVPLEQALGVITTSPAGTYGLRRKGSVAPGFDADFVMLSQDLEIDSVGARGRVALREGRLLIRGTFEPRGDSDGVPSSR